MNINLLIHNNLETYRKNKDDIKALILGRYPEFIYKKINILETNQIPVFAFHSVKAERFEEQLKYLAENNYRTLGSEEFYETLTGKRRYKEKSIVLTFDDGYGSIWSVVYPLLKKYGFRAISFLVTTAIKNEADYYPNLEDVWSGKTSLKEINLRDSLQPLCTWKEIKEIHKSGFIDFQSHTSFHGSIFISDRIIDFANPFLKPSFLYDHLNPLLKINNIDVSASKLELGYPIYEWGSSMSSLKRYIENENICKACIDFVKTNGGENFFYQQGWRHKLKKYYDLVFKELKVDGYYQGKEERLKDIYKDLLNSKKMIESKLDNRVDHLCYPWYRGSDLAVKASKEAGFLCNYWGLFDNKDINRVGDDPYYITRFNDNYIFSLPGKGRFSIIKQILSKIKRYGLKRQIYINHKIF